MLIILATLISKNNIYKISDEIVLSIQKGDFGAIMKYADKKGIIFSINPIIDTTDPKLSPQIFKKILNDTTKLFWGYASGSGMEIYMTFKEFYEKYLKKNYIKGKKSLNKRIAPTNKKDNIKEIFKNADFVEYYLKGKEEYDWHSLILVFNNNVLVAILYDSWSP
ncbi:MAG: hypothetical protein ABIL89_06540 [candidate division WOR-3 bacterium]